MLNPEMNLAVQVFHLSLRDKLRLFFGGYVAVGYDVEDAAKTLGDIDFEIEVKVLSPKHLKELTRVNMLPPEVRH